ncbi:hypothetical protein [Burkholderia sp. Ac-20365]|uniref:hypothetical protein n=1 Tax=Burkholderia sp. Ac-20365 TaxID=2703897 RepID=UPI00197BD2EF|nr:hypothetical protein [Burkholderia sp. Ac-20365]MBN3761105.1 hypothetical protein [Burkholderia sp. Ac-20365]
MKIKTGKVAPWIASVAFGAVMGVVLFHAPLCRKPSMLLDNAEAQYCDIRGSADVGARGQGYPADGERTGLNLRLADTNGYQILFLAGQHQSEETARRVATMLGADGGYLNAHGQYVGVEGQWSVAAAHLDDGPARDADPGTVALLVKKRGASQN